MKRLFKAILLSLVAFTLVSMPVLAAVSYRAAYTIVESSGTAYNMLATSVLVDNQWLADNGFLQDDTLDTRIETLGGAERPHMVATNKTLTSVAIPADSQTNLYFTTANSDLSSTEVITGYDGYITVDDDVTLELGSDFEIEQSGYVDTDYIADKNLVYKEDAFKIYISDDEEITAGIHDYPVVAAVNGGNDVVNQLNHTVNLPAGIEADDLLIVYFSADNQVTVIAFPGGWTQLFQIADGSPTGKVGAWYRVADGTEGATITVTTDINEMTAHTSYRIVDYSGVPETATATGVGVNPDPPNLAPSWGSNYNLWIAHVGYSVDGTDTVTVYPANYADGRNDRSNHAEGVGVGSAVRELEAASDNPGTFTISGAVSWAASTLAIAPADATAHIVTATGIVSDEYTVKTYGVANEPGWATGDVLHFTGAADSNVNATAIHDNIAKLWVSLWFKLDAPYAAGGGNQYIWGKRVDDNNMIWLRLDDPFGSLRFLQILGGVPTDVELYSIQTSWNADQWYHVIASISDTAGGIQRLLVDGNLDDSSVEAAVNTPNGGDFVIGDNDDPGAVTGFIGEIQNVIVGNDDLSTDEETALYTGTAPGDETEYWYIDEGSGTAITSYGSVATTGTADAACAWETATFTTGSTGRWCDFYIEVDDGLADPDRWGTNLQGASVPDNTNDWYLNQNNVMPWMDYYYHTVGGVLHAWYQPNYMVTATDSGGTETAGGSAVLITAAEITEGVDYWVGGLVTITAAAGAAPEGETSIVTASAVGSLTVAPAFTANVDIGDTFTVDFGTLIDRSHYSLYFDGNTDHVTVPDDASLRFGATTDFTLLAWVKTASFAGLPTILFKGAGGGGQGYYHMAVYHVGGDAGKLYAAIYDGVAAVTIQDTTLIDDDVWHFVGATYDRDGNLIPYVDGSPSGTPASIAAIGDCDWATDLIIGSGSAGANELTGNLDGIAIYNRVLSPAEIEYNWNTGAGRYTPYSTSGLVLQLHIEEGSGVNTADTSGEGNNGVITNAIWDDGQVPRPAGNSGTNDSRLSWGANPSGVAVTLGGMVSTGQPTPGALPADPAQDILPETEVTDWHIEPDVTGSLLTNPLRPFVTMLSDNTTLTELQSWRLLALAMILLVTVATASAVGRHQGITAIAAGAAILGVVVLTIFPMWALVFAIGMFIGGLVMERSPSL